MATTNTREEGLEALITNSLITEAGYLAGEPNDYDRAHAVDTAQLFAFLEETQPDVLTTLGIEESGTARTKFLHRLQGEIKSRGVIDVLRKGVKHGPASVDLFYGTPTPGNISAAENYRANRFSVTRQLRYSMVATANALDFAVFINGLPVATFELKNKLTKQTVADAVKQYKEDRDPNELLFQFGRCAVHFAVDDHEVRMTTHLQDKKSWFLPFNKGYNGGAGNPVNPEGVATAYLWKEVLTKSSLTNILENYAQIVKEKTKAGEKRVQIFPRYHQLDVVRKLLADAQESGPGQRYLIQHSAGSGKSNSITWLAHQLVELKRNGQAVFDSVIVITDRKVLDKQIRDNIKNFAQVDATVGAVTQGSGQLKDFIAQGKKIIISTVQKFPYILDEIGNEHRTRRFAILIDEAHSSQSGRTAAAVNVALSTVEEGDDETAEDVINRYMEARKMLGNASYFAFTATPKNKTLEIFGTPYDEGSATKHRPFHVYSMKQAIQEGFIMDVLENYTPVESYYQLIVKKGFNDAEFDKNRALAKMRRYVEAHEHAIRQKSEIMVDHFHEQVIAKRKVGGKARAMVVTSSIRRAFDYWRAFNDYLKVRKSPYKAVIAFSGEQDFFNAGKKYGEAHFNNFPSKDIPERFREDPYRFLIVADKFQTGYDEPLLHTMYVDKPLSDVKAVQTLSRLNRAHPEKHDTFVLDFANDTEVIKKAFERHYRTTILSEATDPNKLHDLKAQLDSLQVYSPEEVDLLVERYLGGAERDRLDPLLDVAVARYRDELGEDDQIAFKGNAKAFVRTYNFLASVLPYTNVDWEKLSVYLNFLTSKLPAPKEEDFSKGILETIDLDSYRAEAKAQRSISLADADSEIDPVPLGRGGFNVEPEIDLLKNIVGTFNTLFGNISWQDVDKIKKIVSEELPEKVAADKAYQNAMKNSDKKVARIEHDKALQRAMIGLLRDNTELYKQFSDNADFKRWLADTVFSLTYEDSHTPQ